MLCCALLTGCSEDGTNYFGTVGNYVLKLGEDMFGTGEQGIVGGELPAEPQGNEETLIFYNYDVKEVDKAPKDEKTAYNLDGPENSGIAATAAPTVTIQPAQGGKAVGSGTVVVLTAGHCDAPFSQYEFTEDQLYFKAAANFIYSVTESVPGQGGKFKLKPYMTYKGSGTPVMGDLCKKAGYVIDSSDGEDEVYKKVASSLFKYGFVQNKNFVKENGSTYLKATVGNVNTGGITKKRKVNFFNQYGAKLDKFVGVLNDAEKKNTALWKNWGKLYSYVDSNSKVDVSFVTSNRNTWAGRGAGIFFKARATGGGSAAISGASDKEKAEYNLNYLITSSLAKKLSGEGYTVINSKSSVRSHNLLDGSGYSNKNISQFAASKKAVLHIVIHCDSAGSGNSGGHLIVPTKDISDAAEDSKKAADAFVAKADKGVLRSSNKINVTTGYTTTNFAEVPTILMECFNMDNFDDCSKFWSVEGSKVVLNENKFWGNGRFDAVVAAIEAIDK